MRFAIAYARFYLAMEVLMRGFYLAAMEFETVLADVFERQRQIEFDVLREETPQWVRWEDGVGLDLNYVVRDTYPLPPRIQRMAKG